MADEAKQAAEAITALGKSAKETAKDLKAAREEAKRAREAAKSEAVGFGVGAAGAGIGALRTPGAGGADAAFAAIQSISAGLPALTKSLGALLGPLGAAAGGLLGTGASAALDRQFGPAAQAREAAIGEVTALGAPLAAAGIKLDPKLVEALLAGAQTRADRNTEFAASVRSQADLSRLFTSRGGT